jgi:hypothetical protein
MIAGIPIATVASAIARASIMTIPSQIGELPERLISSLKNRFPIESIARLLQAYFAASVFCFAVCGHNRASVSRFVAESSTCASPASVLGGTRGRTHKKIASAIRGHCGLCPLSPTSGGEADIL